MIEICHRWTGEVLLTVDAESLRGANLSDANLGAAVLSGVDLSSANLRDANLVDADLTAADLRGVDLSGTDLSGTDLSDADMSGTNLSGAILWETNLSGAILEGANLTNAQLAYAYLWITDLAGANLASVLLDQTSFSNCPTLAEAKGLEAVHHYGPSNLDARTLRACVNKLPDVFLLGVGYTLFEIENLRAMYGHGIEFFSCFLSYARKDAAFAERMHADLIKAGVSCWQDVHDLKGGEFWREQIRDQIRLRDKVIVVCSEESIARTNVVEEIVTGMAEERKCGSLKLFPIRLDDFILTGAAEELARSLPAHLKREDWLGYLRELHIPDFSSWENHRSYQPAFEKLLRDLKGKGAERGAPA